MATTILSRKVKSMLLPNKNQANVTTKTSMINILTNGKIKLKRTF